MLSCDELVMPRQEMLVRSNEKSARSKRLHRPYVLIVNTP